jgi:3-phenylpropionate/trans-cinnamate dioxygenase ferredoxin subunit
VQNTCPHAGGILSGGWCKNGHIVCPIHRYEYSLQTGRGAIGQGDYIDIYPVEERVDGVYIGLKESFWKKLFS